MTVRGKGSLAYVDVDSDDQYEVVDCSKNFTLPGIDAGVVEEEPCLDDDLIDQDVGDPKITPFQLTALYDINSTMFNAMETAAKARTEIKMAAKVPKTTAVYVFMVGKISKFQPQQTVRDKKLAVDIEFLPTAAPTKSTVAPTLEA